jgi:hypothetical protein
MPNPRLLCLLNLQWPHLGKHHTYRSLCMVQLHTPGKSSLCQEADLRDDELIDLQVLALAVQKQLGETVT